MRHILRKSFKKHFSLIFFCGLNFSFISTEFENLSLVCLILLAILTFKHKKKTTSHFIEVSAAEKKCNFNKFFLLLKNDEKICEKIYLLRHIKLTIAHKNLIFSKQEFCHVSFLQHTVEYPFKNQSLQR